ncbi:MAG: glycosyltransferase family 2 protein, partial [Primorskyibacter sp.]
MTISTGPNRARQNDDRHPEDTMARRWPVFFDSSWYLAVYPDVAAAGRNARRHYLRHGRHEGRWPTALRAVWHERDLRWGLLDGALTRLHDLAQTATGAEAVWARLACARAAVRDDDWHTAADWLAPLDPDQDIVRGFALPDPALLAIEVAIATQDVPRATQICAAARRWFGKTPDIRLAHANLRALTHGHDAAWQRIMAGVFRTRGLSGLCVTLGDSSGSPSGNPSGESPAFDRLGPAAGLWTSRKSGPLVSVIVPARDCADTLPTALRSLCQQTHQTLEIIVVENGSTDATASVAARWATAHPGRIRVLRAPDAASAYDARNLGMATATGAYVTVLDADDWAHPQRITRQVATLRRTSKAAATICDWV